MMVRGIGQPPRRFLVAGDGPGVMTPCITVMSMSIKKGLFPGRDGWDIAAVAPDPAAWGSREGLACNLQY